MPYVLLVGGLQASVAGRNGSRCMDGAVIAKEPLGGPNVRNGVSCCFGYGGADRCGATLKRRAPAAEQGLHAARPGIRGRQLYIADRPACCKRPGGGVGLDWSAISVFSMQSDGDGVCQQFGACPGLGN